MALYPQTEIRDAGCVGTSTRVEPKACNQKDAGFLETRAEILALMLAHHPLAARLTAKHIQPRLSRYVSLRWIQKHMEAIRAEYAAKALRSANFNPQRDRCSMRLMETLTKTTTGKLGS